MSYSLLFAAFLTLLINLMHIFLGGKAIAKPLLSLEKMPSIVKYTLYMCWHFVTITLFAMMLFYILSATHAKYLPLAMAANFMCFLFVASALIMIVKFNLRHTRHPQWIMFLVLGLVGSYAVWG